ncbi:SCP-like protein [Ancylostoma duodenale]|uniref:SCP-like protein n=1 Tax=Ancylostoma duodenale TaxID=51022 RepID=A0A0C2FEB7_9BILA|nr:SCP-like protein [Ancylostoma duodenale]
MNNGGGEVYDCDAEDSAYKSALSCSTTASSEYDENVHDFEEAISGVDIVLEACNSWYSETFELKGRNIYNSTDNTSNIANMVWCTHTKLGCAVVNCPSGTHVVCHYTPKEKAGGATIYEKDEQ